MSIDITGITRHGWIWGGSTATLEILALQDFVTAAGEIVKRGHYRSFACTVSGESLSIPTITGFPTTTDALPRGPWWRAILKDYKHTKREDWISAFSLSHVAVSPTNWTDILISNNPPQPQPRPPGVNYDEVQLLLRQQQGSLRLAAVGFPGIAEPDVAPEDSARPIFVGPNSPLLKSAGFLDAGNETLVAGEVTTVLSTEVENDSPLDALSMTDDISGRLRCFNRVVGVSFDVVSENGADAGDFRWYVRASS